MTFEDEEISQLRDLKNFALTTHIFKHQIATILKKPKIEFYSGLVVTLERFQDFKSRQRRPSLPETLIKK
jgi:hypothetical protein